MHTNKKLIICVVISLLVGLSLGFCVGKNKNSRSANVHTMPDGTVMSNELETGIDHAMESMSAGLRGKTGNAFDKEFLSEMIVHHQGAVDMAQMVLKTSKRPELLELARDIISAQTGEIKMMQEWQKAWFK
ncbi:MAG: DUF305 domain-containing protein [bacterium]